MQKGNQCVSFAALAIIIRLHFIINIIMVKSILIYEPDLQSLKLKADGLCNLFAVI